MKLSRTKAIAHAYFQEENSYSVEEIAHKLSFYDELGNINQIALRDFLRGLISNRVIEPEKNKKSVDIEFLHRNDCNLDKDKLYKIIYVGIVVYHNRVLFMYPKYIDNNANLESISQGLRLALRALEKYYTNRIKKSIKIFDLDLFLDESDEITKNLLSTIFFLLEDFGENGPYDNSEQIIETNGFGEPCWQKTTDEIFPIFQDGRPIYTSIYSKRRKRNYFDYIRQLHISVVSRCSEEIVETEINKYYSVPVFDSLNNDDEIEYDENYALERIEAELKCTFNDRKLLVLKALKTYILSNGSLLGENELQLIGTSSFHAIWEKACAEVFVSQKGDEDEYGKTINLDNITPKIDYSIINKYFDGKTPTLVELIENPVWRFNQKGRIAAYGKPLNPDFLRFEKKDNHLSKDRYVFFILDAKYYCPTWAKNMKKKYEWKICNQPGVEDIAKQYLYALAYRDILEYNGIKTIKNYFIMPKRLGFEKRTGKVKMDILERLNLNSIELRMIDPNILFHCYIENKHLSLWGLDKNDYEDGNIDVT